MTNDVNMKQQTSNRGCEQFVALLELQRLVLPLGEAGYVEALQQSMGGYLVMVARLAHTAQQASSSIWFDGHPARHKVLSIQSIKRPPRCEWKPHVLNAAEIADQVPGYTQ